MTGRLTLLRYQAYPYQKFGHYQGKVQRVSRSALSSGELGSLIGNAEAGEPYYRVVVILDKQTVRAFGKDEILKPGLLLEADILGERRKLWEWVLERSELARVVLESGKVRNVQGKLPADSFQFGFCKTLRWDAAGLHEFLAH